MCEQFSVKKSKALLKPKAGLNGAPVAAHGRLSNSNQDNSCGRALFWVLGKDGKLGHNQGWGGDLTLENLSKRAVCVAGDDDAGAPA